MAFDAYGSADIQALALYYGAGIAGYATAGFLNFFLRRPFVADAVLGFALATALAAGYLVFFTQKQLPFGEAATADWRILPAAVLILFALFVLAALALPAAWAMSRALRFCPFQPSAILQEPGSTISAMPLPYWTPVDPILNMKATCRRMLH